MHFGDRVIARVTCFKLGTSSLGLRYVFSIGDSICLDARMTTVCVELDTLKSFPIPEAYRAKFERLLE